MPVASSYVVRPQTEKRDFDPRKDKPERIVLCPHDFDTVSKALQSCGLGEVWNAPTVQVRESLAIAANLERLLHSLKLKHPSKIVSLIALARRQRGLFVTKSANPEDAEDAERVTTEQPKQQQTGEDAWSTPFMREVRASQHVIRPAETK